MKEFLEKIKTSFFKAIKGEEQINVIVYWWGYIAYLFAFFVADKLVKINSLHSVDIIISATMVIYFSVHLYALKKCAPKKPKLSKEEKLKLREDSRKDFNKRLVRKLLLQESIKKWNPIFVTMVIDAFCMAHFLGYVF